MQKQTARDERKTIIYLARHAEATRLPGEKEEKLTSVGREEAKEFAKSLLKKEGKVDLIVSSPLSRSMKSAEIIAEILNVPIVVSLHVGERDMGRYKNIPKNIFERENPDLIKKFISLSKEERWKFKFFPDVESNQEIAERVSFFLNECLKNYAEKTILIITHGATIATYLAYLKWGDHEVPPHLSYFKIEVTPTNQTITETRGIFSK